MAEELTKEEANEFVADQLKQMETMEDSYEQELEDLDEDGYETVTDPPWQDDKEKGGTKTDAPTTKEPEEDDIAGLRSELASLREELARSKETPKTDAPTTEEPISEEDFLGDTEMDSIITDKNEFNKLLNKVYLKGVATGTDRQKKITTVTDESVGKTIRSSVMEIAALQRASENFYAANKDLANHRDKVSEVYKDLAAQNPDKDHLQILELTGPEVRKRHSIKPVKQDDDETPPRLRKKGTQQRQPTQQKQSNPMLDELDAMDKALDL